MWFSLAASQLKKRRPPAMSSSGGGGEASVLRARDAAAMLPVEHPLRIFGREHARLFEDCQFFGRQCESRHREVVVELRDGLGADDDAHDGFLMQNPGERNSGDRD